MFAGADDFPKFVKVGAAREHELRKMGTGASRDAGLRTVVTVKSDRRG
jgi:hypothetical protein